MSSERKKPITILATNPEIYGAEKVKEAEFFEPRERFIQMYRKGDICLVLDNRYCAPEHKFFSDIYISKCHEAEQIFRKLKLEAERESRKARRKLKY